MFIELPNGEKVEVDEKTLESLSNNKEGTNE